MEARRPCYIYTKNDGGTADPVCLLVVALGGFLCHIKQRESRLHDTSKRLLGSSRKLSPTNLRNKTWADGTENGRRAASLKRDACRGETCKIYTQSNPFRSKTFGARLAHFLNSLGGPSKQTQQTCRVCKSSFAFDSRAIVYIHTVQRKHDTSLQPTPTARERQHLAR